MGTAAEPFLFSPMPIHYLAANTLASAINSSAEPFAISTPAYSPHNPLLSASQMECEDAVGNLLYSYSPFVTQYRTPSLTYEQPYLEQQYTTTNEELPFSVTPDSFVDVAVLHFCDEQEVCVEVMQITHHDFIPATAVRKPRVSRVRQNVVGPCKVTKVVIFRPSLRTRIRAQFHDYIGVFFPPERLADWRRVQKLPPFPHPKQPILSPTKTVWKAQAAAQATTLQPPSILPPPSSHPCPTAEQSVAQCKRCSDKIGKQTPSDGMYFLKNGEQILCTTCLATMFCAFIG